MRPAELDTPAMRLDPTRAPKPELVVAVGDLQALVRSLLDRLEGRFIDPDRA